VATPSVVASWFADAIAVLGHDTVYTGITPDVDERELAAVYASLYG
jgi:hypothetical protein